MKNRYKQIERRFRNRIKRKNRKKTIRRKNHELYLRLKAEFSGDFGYDNQIEMWLPANLSYLIGNEKAKFAEYVDQERRVAHLFRIKVPKIFSLIEASKESYHFIRSLTMNILSDRYKSVEIDYADCQRIDLSAQIYMDMVLRDIDIFIKRKNRYPFSITRIDNLSGINIHNPDIQKLLFSVGSPAILNKRSGKFKDVLAYNLCVHNKQSNKLENERRKEIDSTEMVDYVIDSLAMLNKELTDDSIEDLSIVIGEILINAEEHSTTNYRYSTGYFQKYELEGEIFGIFHLAIMNFGETIYEKFKSPECTNHRIKQRMAKLSENYTKKRLFSSSFEEESLWTLYALQEGVTSVAKKRGNGSIRFIESFFNLKGTNDRADDISRMGIISGNTNILFDGTYGIKKVTKGNESFSLMTFNNSGSLEDKPDNKYVKFVDEYFPGTIISARILINKDDVI